MSAIPKKYHGFCPDCGRMPGEFPTKAPAGQRTRPVCQVCGRAIKTHYDTGWNDCIAAWEDAASRPGDLEKFIENTNRVISEIQKANRGESYDLGAKEAFECCLKTNSPPERRD